MATNAKDVEASKVCQRRRFTCKDDAEVTFNTYRASWKQKEGSPRSALQKSFSIMIELLD